MNHSRAYESNPCTDKLTDIEYLKHMIPHHQVAIDKSNLLAPISRNPTIIHMCRDITQKQSFEILEMGGIMDRHLSSTLFSNEMGSTKGVDTVMDKFHPIMSKSADGSCNRLFFKPSEHSNNMKDMKITDKSYLEHMIPHHQVAVDMSRRLLLHTNNSYLLYFCRKLIVDQQGEIYTMNNLLNNSYNFESTLF